MKMKAVTRQNRTSLWKKTKWALHDKKEVDSLLEAIASLTAQLVNLWPAKTQAQQQLCVAEMKEIEHIDSTPVFLILSLVAGD
jgi:hypothetical protein